MQFPYVHFIAAAIMFLILAGFCVIFHRRAIAKKAIQRNLEAGRPAWVYALSGIVIVTLAADAGFDHFISSAVPRLVASGASWLTASRTATYSQKDERSQYFT